MTKAKTSCYPWFWHPMWCQINPNNWSPEHLSPNRATISTGLNQTWRLGAGWPPANSALVNLTWWMAIMTIHSLFRRISRIIWQGSPHAMLGGGAGWCFRVRDATLKDFWLQSIKHRTLSSPREGCYWQTELPQVGGGKTFWRGSRIFLRKQL